MSGDANRPQIVVDYDECEANAICQGIIPEIFQVDDDDNLNVLNEYPSDDQIPKVQEAVDMCPKRALFLKGAQG